MLEANAINTKNDIIISTAVLAGLLLTSWQNIPLIDVITALVISGWIMWSAIEIFLKSSTELLDGIQDYAMYEKVIKAVESVPEVSHPHRIRIRQMGHLYMVSLDIEVSPDLTVKKAHSLSQQTDSAIRGVFSGIYDIIIHIEPRHNVEQDEKFGVSKDDLS